MAFERRVGECIGWLRQPRKHNKNKFQLLPPKKKTRTNSKAEKKTCSRQNSKNYPGRYLPSLHQVAYSLGCAKLFPPEIKDHPPLANLLRHHSWKKTYNNNNNNKPNSSSSSNINNKNRLKSNKSCAKYHLGPRWGFSRQQIASKQIKWVHSIKQSSGSSASDSNLPSITSLKKKIYT